MGCTILGPHHQALLLDTGTLVSKGACQDGGREEKSSRSDHHPEHKASRFAIWSPLAWDLWVLRCLLVPLSCWPGPLRWV